MATFTKAQQTAIDNAVDQRIAAMLADAESLLMANILHHREGARKDAVKDVDGKFGGNVTEAAKQLQRKAVKAGAKAQAAKTATKVANATAKAIENGKTFICLGADDGKGGYIGQCSKRTQNGAFKRMYEVNAVFHAGHSGHSLWDLTKGDPPVGPGGSFTSV